MMDNNVRERVNRDFLHSAALLYWWRLLPSVLAPSIQLPQDQTFGSHSDKEKS